jgi:hypothetical protein
MAAGGAGAKKTEGVKSICAEPESVKEREQRRADLSGEEGGEDESGAPVGAGEERWRRLLDLRREEVCSHGPCTADLRRERRGEGDGEGAVRTMCGSRTGGWSLPCVMSD